MLRKHNIVSKTKIMRAGVLPPQPLRGGITIMDQTQFNQIKQYGAMLAIASRLHKRGLTTKAEHCLLTAELQRKYRPAASSLSGVSPAPNKNITEKVLGKEEILTVSNQ